MFPRNAMRMNAEVQKTISLRGPAHNANPHEKLRADG